MERRFGPGLRRAESYGLPAGYDGTGRNPSSALEGDGVGLAVHAFEAEGRAGFLEQGKDRHGAAGRDGEAVPRADVRDPQRPPVPGTAERRVGEIDGADAGAVPGHRALLYPPADQHQKDKDGHEIEIDQLLAAQQPAEKGSGPRDGHAEGDGQVDVENPHPGGVPGPAHEPETADSVADRGEEKGEESEEIREGEILLHAQIAGQREEHGVQREKGADSDPSGEGTAPAVFVARSGGETVAETANIPGEGDRGKDPRVPFEPRPSRLGVD